MGASEKCWSKRRKNEGPGRGRIDQSEGIPGSPSAPSPSPLPPRFFFARSNIFCSSPLSDSLQQAMSRLPYSELGPPVVSLPFCTLLTFPSRWLPTIPCGDMNSKVPQNQSNRIPSAQASGFIMSLFNCEFLQLYYSK